MSDITKRLCRKPLFHEKVKNMVFFGMSCKQTRLHLFDGIGDIAKFLMEK